MCQHGVGVPARKRSGTWGACWHTVCQHTSNTNLLKTRRCARSHALLAAGHTRARLRGSGALCGHVAGPGIAGREPGHPFYGVAERPGQDFNTTGWVQYYTRRRRSTRSARTARSRASPRRASCARRAARRRTPRAAPTRRAASSSDPVRHRRSSARRAARPREARLGRSYRPQDWEGKGA